MSHPIVSTSQEFATRHCDVVGNCFLMEHHTDEDCVVRLYIPEARERIGLRQLCARLTGILLIPKSKQPPD
jgi:hypothetical protein